MFVVDLIAASFLAIVLTVAFAALLRGRGCPRWSKLPTTLWLMTIASWAGGILVVAFGPALTGTHWLPFAITGLLVGLLVITLRRMPAFRDSLASETGEPGNDVRPAVALYFVVTLLLFFSAISLRFYVVNLA